MQMDGHISEIINNIPKKKSLEKHKNIIGEKEIINIELEIYNIYIF
jgi:hypothetical protein